MNRPPLVRALADLVGPAVVTSSQPFAERVGEWLHFKDALSLFSVLNGEVAAATDQAPPASAVGAELREMYARTRATLIASIVDAAWRQRDRDRAESGQAVARSLERVERTEANGAATAEAEAADFTTYHRHYVARQREMTSSIAALQTSVRAALSQQSAAMRRLVALDGVLDQALAVRRGNLLAAVPRLLTARFEALRQQAQQEANTDMATPAAAWLTTFCHEMQTVLLAELELRLQPVAGLIAALDNEVSNKRG